MALLVTPTIWTRQPQFPARINPQFADGLQFVWNGSVPTYQHARGGPVEASGTGLTTRPGAITGTGAGTGKYTGTIAADATAVTWVIMAANASTLNGRPASTFNGSGGHDIFTTISNTMTFQEIFSGGANGQYAVANLFYGAKPTCVAYANAGLSGGGPAAIFVDGVSTTWTVSSAQSGTRVAGGTNVAVAGRPDVTNRQFGGDVYFVAMWSRVLPSSDLQTLSQNPWQIFAPIPERLWVEAASGTPTGTLAYTNANDTLAGVGAQTNTGTLATTNANDTSAGSGTQTNTGTLARANANDTLAGAGAQTNTGTLAYSNANDTLSAVGFLATTGTLATTNANDALAATGSGGDLIDSFYDRPSKRKEKFSQKREERDDRLQDILQMFEAKMEPPKIAPIVVKPVAKPAFDYERDDEETLMALL